MQLLRSQKSAGRRIRLASLAILAAMVPMTAAAATLDRIREAGKLNIGYAADAPPFSYDEAGKPSGYAVALCEKVADEVKAELALPDLAVEWVPVKLEDRFQAVQQGTVDILCGAVVTLTRRKDVDFSISIFPSGTGALLRRDVPIAVREILQFGRPISSQPIWRGSPARTVLEEQTFSAVKGTTAETWLRERLSALEIAAEVVTVDNFAAGVDGVVDGSADVFFGDVAILLDASKRHASSGDLIVLPRLFTNEPIALVVPRGDDDFDLVVDRALSKAYRAEGFRDFFAGWFGPPDEAMVNFFRETALPE